MELRIAGAQLTDSAVELLIDYGTKEGPDQAFDYEAVTIFKAFDPKYLSEYDDFRLLEADTYTFIENWPLMAPGRELAISSDTQYKANLFLSNFSEQRYRGNPDYSSAEYAHFAMEWMEVNKYKELMYKDNYSWLSQEQISKILDRYFGTVLCEEDFYRAGDNNVYGGIIKKDKDGKAYYCEPLADGEMYLNNAFSVVSSIEDLGSGNKKDKSGDGYFRMNYTIYSLEEEDYDADGIGKKQYSLTQKEAAKLAGKGELYEAGTGSAIVYETSSGEYKLMYYLLH